MAQMDDFANAESLDSSTNRPRILGILAGAVAGVGVGLLIGLRYGECRGRAKERQEAQLAAELAAATQMVVAARPWRFWQRRRAGGQAEISA